MSKVLKSFRISEEIVGKVEFEFGKFSVGAPKIIEEYYGQSGPLQRDDYTSGDNEESMENKEHGYVNINITGYQEMILRQMFPGKTVENLIEAMIDHLIPDVDKKNIAWLDEYGNVLKEYESKFPLDEKAPQWKKNLRMLQATDRMLDKAGIKPPPPPKITYTGGRK